MNIAGIAPDFARFYPISYQVTRPHFNASARHLADPHNETCSNSQQYRQQENLHRLWSLDNIFVADILANDSSVGGGHKLSARGKQFGNVLVRKMSLNHDNPVSVRFVISAKDVL